MTETSGGWLPSSLQLRMVRDAEREDHESRRAEKELQAVREQRAEDASNRALTLALEAAVAAGGYVNPVQAVAALPATDAERDQRARAALEFSLAGHRAEWLAEAEKLERLAAVQAELGSLGQDGEKTHIDFIDDPVILHAAARSSVALQIFHKARHFGDQLAARRRLQELEGTGGPVYIRD